MEKKQQLDIEELAVLTSKIDFINLEFKLNYYIFYR